MTVPLLSLAALGNDYSAVVVPVCIVATGFTFQFSSGSLGTLLITNGYISANIIRQAGATTVAVLLSFLLAPAALSLAVIFVVNDLLGTAFYLSNKSKWGVR